MEKAAQLLCVKSAMTSSLLTDRSCGTGRMGPDTMLLRDVNISALMLLLCVRALHGSALPAVSSYEFTAYRMQQYNLAQQKHGRMRHLCQQTVNKTIKLFPDSYFKTSEAVLNRHTAAV